MAISVEEVRAFVADAKKARESWLSWADRSWSEIKKRQRNNKPLDPRSSRRRGKYPAWFNIFKIRQPLYLSRIGIPLCKDTTQDGIDHLGASAAFFKERLAVNLVKSFPFFDALSTARDDFIATNFGTLRAYYERDEIKEKVKERITPQQVPGTEDMVFLDAAGQPIESDDIGQDDEGFFLETDQVVDVENERVCLEQVLYKDVFIDPDIKRFNRCERIAFAHSYSVPQFKKMFGARAYAMLPKKDDDDSDATPKRQTLTVYEYWDKYERDVYWLPENGQEFIKPLAYAVPEEFEEGEQPNGLYDLEGFFPLPPPLVTNQATDEFWPVPEYYQVIEIIEDIHTIFGRMMALTRAIRARLLFDDSIEGLQEALAEATEGDAFGVPNLSQALVNNGGTLDSVVQYIPVDKMIASLEQVYGALEQRLNTLYRLTGVSDLLQGLISDGTQRTFGERQMLEKYALNQHAEPQRKMQEFVRDCYELLCEMALKNFKDESLERYMMPRTAPQTHQQNYTAALELLKDDRKRFRIELETDSTIALNEQYDKAMRSELVSALTGAIEKVAAIASTNPSLVTVELHALKFLIQGMRQGKMFQQEITQAIDGVIQQMQAAQGAPPPPDAAVLKAEIDKQRLALDVKAQEFEQQKAQVELQLKQGEIASAERVRVAELQAQQQIESLRAQLEQLKLQTDSGSKVADRQLEYERLRQEIAISIAQLQQERDKISIEAQTAAKGAELEAYKVGITERMTNFDQQLQAAQQRLEEQRMALDMQERYLTEQRLQQEAELTRAMAAMELIAKQSQTQADAIKAAAEARATLTPQKRKKIKVSRDANGEIAELEVEGHDPGA